MMTSVLRSRPQASLRVSELTSSQPCCEAVIYVDVRGTMARCAPDMHCLIPILFIHTTLTSSVWSRPVGLAAVSLRAQPQRRKSSCARRKPSEDFTELGRHSHISPALLEAGRSMARRALRLRQGEKHSHVYVIRSFGRAKAFREMTCGILERLLPCLGVCLLAVAADDPELETYRQNAGPWKDRMLVGVRGAERQVAFIDQIMPKGPSLSSTLVVALLA